MRLSDGSSDVCSSDLANLVARTSGGTAAPCFILTCRQRKCRNCEHCYISYHCSSKNPCVGSYPNGCLAAFHMRNVTVEFQFDDNGDYSIASAADGKWTVMVVPFPGVLMISMRPRCRSTMCLTMARPRPVPPMRSAERRVGKEGVSTVSTGRSREQ